MKKVFAILLVIALLVVPMSLSVSAEGAINAEEQRIMEALKSSVTVNGVEFKIPENYVNQAENYLKTHDVTKAEADEVLGYINEGKEIVKASDLKKTSDLKVLPKKDKQAILDLGKKACAVVESTLTYDGKNVTIVANDSGETLFDAAPIVKTTGADSDFSVMAIVVSSVVVLLGAAFVASKKLGLIK
ncbi:MAG: hypothetical protein IKK77_01260 [Clostridia bacterium]|nr:hypothetical protein [Clostridia bacterium]